MQFIANNLFKIMGTAVVLYLILVHSRGFAQDATAGTQGIARVVSALDGNPFTGK